MNRNIDKKDLFELYRLLEESNNFFHQPLNFNSIDGINEFARKYYPVIKEMYYKTIWNWLTEEEQEEWMKQN